MSNKDCKDNQTKTQQLDAWFDANINSMCESNEVLRGGIDVFQRGLNIRLRDNYLTANDIVLLLMFEQLQEQQEICAEAADAVRAFKKSYSEAGSFAFCLHGSLDGVIKTTLALHRHLHLNWRAAFRVARQLCDCDGAPVRLERNMTRTGALAAIENLPGIDIELVSGPGTRSEELLGV